MIDWKEFNKLDAQGWKSKVDLDLKGKKVASDFSYNVENDFFISPFLTQADTSSIERDPNQHTKSCVWINDNDIKAANLTALNYLNLGAEYLIIEVGNDWSLNVLLKDIHLEMIGIVLIAKTENILLNTQLRAYLDVNYVNKTTDISIIHHEDVWFSFEDTFKKRLKKFSQLSKAYKPNEQQFIIIALKKDFFAQISELRAIRKIWANDGNKPNNLTVIALAEAQNIINTDVHPLIIINYLLMSAHLGMSDVAVFRAKDDDEDLARLSLNIQHIFKEESNLGVVSDPVAGAYILETLTNEMVQSVS